MGLKNQLVIAGHHLVSYIFIIVGGYSPCSLIPCCWPIFPWEPGMVESPSAAVNQAFAWWQIPLMVKSSKSVKNQKQILNKKQPWVLVTKSASQSCMMFPLLSLLLAIPIGYSSRNYLVQNSIMESWNKPSYYQWLFWGLSPANQLLQRQCFAPPLLSAFPPAVPVAPQWCVPPGRETLGEAVGWFGWRVVVEYAIPWDSQIKTAIIVIKKTIRIPPWVPKIYSQL